MLGPYCLQDFYTNEKILTNVNMVVLGQVKIENSSLPVAVRVSKTRVLKLPSGMEITILFNFLGFVGSSITGVNL